jgi:ribonucleotide monophosphatase NagD (HAD superfamily)
MFHPHRFTDCLKISVNQFIQSHTPYKHFADEYPNVVVFSKDEEKCRDVAERYGFRNVWTATDVNANFPDLWPFRSDHPEDYKPIYQNQTFDAALVFNDPAYYSLGSSF